MVCHHASDAEDCQFTMRRRKGSVRCDVNAHHASLSSRLLVTFAPRLEFPKFRSFLQNLVFFAPLEVKLPSNCAQNAQIAHHQKG
jgi:hypothetical protein